MEWQPIETAPRDGSIILLHRPTAAPWAQVTIGKWNSNQHATRPRPFWELWICIGSVTESREWTPTHWMPLPPPPATHP